jgi:hypothetical protein
MLLGASLSLALALARPAASRATEPGAQDEPPETTTQAQGLNAPTFDGPWRFFVAPYAWLPDKLRFHVDSGGQSGSVNLGLNDLWDALEGAAEIETEVRKGTFGAYFDFIWISLDFNKRAGPFSLKVDDRAVLMNYGASYELGRWKLGDGPRAPVVTVEPYAGGRSLVDHVKLDFQRFPGDTVKINFTAPVLGVRTLWDLTERWNLRISGDYGGFGIDHARATWQAFAGVGYRFHIRGIRTNFLVGYRALGINFKESGVRLKMVGRGPIAGLGFEF